MATFIGTIATNGHATQKQDFTQARTGLITLSEQWLINAADLFGAIPAFQTAHPDYAYLFFQEAKITSMGVSLCRVTVIYEGGGFTEGGGGGPPDSTGPVYSLQGGTMTTNITQHPSIEGWIYTERAAGRDPLDSAGLFVGWKLGAVSSGTKSIYGLDNYETPAVFWSKEWMGSSSPSSSDIGEIGSINTPDGSPPTPSGTNWLCIENSFRRVGSAMYQRTKRWKLSQSNAGGGWNSDVY